MSVPLPLNVIAEVSNLFLKRLQRKPNWRREEVVEEFEEALNEWIKSHNLVAVPIPRTSTPTPEAGVWLEFSREPPTRSNWMHVAMTLPVDDPEALRDDLRMMELLMRDGKPRPVERVVPPQPEPIPIEDTPTLTSTGGQQCSFVSSLRSTARTIYRVILSAAKLTGTPTNSK